MKQLMRSVVVLCTSLCGMAAFADAAEHLVHKWTFNDGTAKDSVGSADGTLYGTAEIVAGTLVLSGASSEDRMETARLGHTLSNRTLVAWCKIIDLVVDKSCAGGPLSISEGSAWDSRFDAIVFGERTAGQWMNGSDRYNRTPENNGGAVETSTGLVMMTVVIQPDPYIVRIYRNGELYAEHSYLRAGETTVPILPANIKALIGPRNWNSGYFRGIVDEARIYADALTAEEVMAIYEAGPDRGSDEDADVVIFGSTEGLVATNGLVKLGRNATYQVKSVERAEGVFDIRGGRLLFGDGIPLHRWSFNDGTARDAFGAADGTLSGTARIGDGALHLSGGVISKNPNSMISSKVNETIGELTLMAWCAVDDPDADGSCAGGPIALSDGVAATAGENKSKFNAIVLGERKKGQWMNGSDHWNRTPADNGGAAETSTDKVMIAAVVHDGGTEIYRNGVLYAAHTTGGAVPVLSTAMAQIGPRNQGDGYFNGSVDDARIYGAPLTAEAVAAIAARGPDGANGDVDEALSNVVVRLGGNGTVFDLGLMPRLVKCLEGAGEIRNGMPEVSEILCATGTLSFADGLALGEGVQIGMVGNDSVIRVCGALELPAKATVVATGLTNGTESVELMRTTLPVDWATLTKGWKFSTDLKKRHAKPYWTETTFGLRMKKNGLAFILM